MKFNIHESIQSAVKSALLILKLIIPLFILAEILLYLDVLQYVAFIFEPITDILDLPKEASIGIATAMFFNIYAGLAFLAPLDLNPYEWTVLGLFLGVAHSMVIENTVMKKMGIPYLYSWALRIVMAFVAILPLQLIPKEYFQPTGEVVETIQHKVYESFPEMLWQSLQDATILSLKVIFIVTAIIFVMDYIKSRDFMQRYQGSTNRVVSIVAGLLLGITYGAGIIISEVEKGTLTKIDILYIATFLMICHSVIEDVLLFVIFGANGWIILTIRVILAIVVSWFLVFLVRRLSFSK